MKEINQVHSHGTRSVLATRMFFFGAGSSLSPEPTALPYKSFFKNKYTIVLNVPKLYITVIFIIIQVLHNYHSTNNKFKTTCRSSLPGLSIQLPVVGCFHIPHDTWFYIASIIYIVIAHLVEGANGSGAFGLAADDGAQKTQDDPRCGDAAEMSMNDNRNRKHSGGEPWS